MENHPAAEIDEMAPRFVVDGDEKSAVGGDGNAGDVGRALAW